MQTQADKQIQEVKSLIQSAVKNLASVITEPENGYNNYKEEYKRILLEHYNSLVLMRDKL